MEKEKGSIDSSDSTTRVDKVSSSKMKAPDDLCAGFRLILFLVDHALIPYFVEMVHANPKNTSCVVLCLCTLSYAAMVVAAAALMRTAALRRDGRCRASLCVLSGVFFLCLILGLASEWFSVFTLKMICTVPGLASIACIVVDIIMRRCFLCYRNCTDGATTDPSPTSHHGSHRSCSGFASFFLNRIPEIVMYQPQSPAPPRPCHIAKIPHGIVCAERMPQTPEADEKHAEIVVSLKDAEETLDKICRSTMYHAKRSGEDGSEAEVEQEDTNEEVIRLLVKEKMSNRGLKCLSKMPNLRILNLGQCRLNSLPDSICQCRSLVDFDASYNQLTYLPTDFGSELVNLRILRVHNNKLHSLPTSIGKMTNLRLFDAHVNELRGLPLSIGKLENLETLNVSKNFSDFRELPITFGCLVNLKELDLSYNEIRSLPDTFGLLKNLKKINLEQTPLSEPPADVIAQGVDAIKEYMLKKFPPRRLEEESITEEVATQQSPQTLLRPSVSLVGKLAGYLCCGAHRPKQH